MSDKKSISHRLMSGVSTGIISTFIFNPFDKALYLMVRDNKSIFNKEIWKNPYHGVTQALLSRTLGYGVYFSIYDICRENLSMKNVLAGSVTGASMALVCNPINVVKMYNWNSNTSKGLIKMALEMKKKYGMQKFSYGLKYTISRDLIYSNIFYILNDGYNKEKSFVKTMGIGCCATALSSPLNYCRNRLYYDFSKYISMKEIIQELHSDMYTKTISNKISYLINNKFCIGWGTLRVGFGMAVSKKIYDFFEKN